MITLRRPSWRGLTLRLLVIVLAPLLLVVCFQSAFIYFPGRYEGTVVGHAPPPERLPAGFHAVVFRGDAGAQVAYYRPAPGGEPAAAPERMWVLAGGNAALALDYADLAEGYPGAAAFLLVDYPGYGVCRGAPGPSGVAGNVSGAVDAVAAMLGLHGDQLWRRTALLGHSLGCAAVLAAGAGRPVRGAVLAAPFTSMGDMAWRQFGPLAWGLWHRYDNRARLRELLEGSPSAPVTIVHGGRDPIIPATMGRELAALDGRVRFVDAPLADHGSIVDDGHLWPLMRAIDEAPSADP